MSMGDWVMGVVAALGFGPSGPPVFNGYLEADYVYVAPLTAGRIVGITAEEGAIVQQGQVLVTLDQSTEEAALQAAEAGVAHAEADLADLETGSRAAEIAVVEATLKRAEAGRDQAQVTLDRTNALVEKGAATHAQLDEAQTVLAAAVAQVEQFRAQLEVEKLPARAAQSTAAEAALAMAKAEAEKARISLADRVLRAPVSGLLDRRFYEPGEIVAAGAPVLSIFQPERIKVIFYVPEAQRAAMVLGTVLHLGCDGCPDGLEARVIKLAIEPQYTPPILYSRDERGRLVFAVEARVAGAKGLLPGQPVTLWY